MDLGKLEPVTATPTVRQELVRLNTALAEIDKCLNGITGCQNEYLARPEPSDLLSYIRELIEDAHGFANTILEQAHIITANL